MDAPVITNRKELMRELKVNQQTIERLMLIGRLDEALHRLDNVHIPFRTVKAQVYRLRLHYYAHKLKTKVIKTPSEKSAMFDDISQKIIINVVTFCMDMEADHG